MLCPHLEGMDARASAYAGKLKQRDRTEPPLWSCFEKEERAKGRLQQGLGYSSISITPLYLHFRETSARGLNTDAVTTTLQVLRHNNLSNGPY
ncbi:MAG: hypothetical protein ACXV45_08260, partial [Halobacteriota archaeon]